MNIILKNIKDLTGKFSPAYDLIKAVEKNLKQLEKQKTYMIPTVLLKVIIPEESMILRDNALKQKISLKR